MSRSNYRGYLGIAGIAGLLTAQMAIAEEAGSLPIKKISVDSSKQIVVEFSKGGFPTVPHVLDLPGPNHRVVLDFVDATIDKDSIGAADSVSSAISQALPAVKGLRYSQLSNSEKPTARVVLDLPESVQAKPRVVKLEEGQITISLGDDVQGASAPSAEPATTAAATAGDASPAQPSGEATAPAASEAKAAAVPAGDTAAAPTTAAANPGSDNAPSAGGWDWTNKQVAAKDAAPAPLADPPEPALKPAIPDGGPATDSAAQPSAPAAVETTPAATAPAESTAPATPDTTNTPPATQPVDAAAPATTESAPAATTPESKPNPQEAVQRYNDAVKAHLSGKLTDAIEQYKGALQANPDLAEAHSNLGMIFNQQHNYAQALSEFRKALAINPKDAITYNGIGAALRAEKDLLGAIKNWQTAVSLDPHLATAHYNLGTAYEKQKDWDKAIDCYRQAVKNDYRLGEAYYRLGLIMEHDKHRPDEAAQQYSQALKVSATAEYSEDARQRLAFLTQTKRAKK